jgi:hypothetical protein
MSGIASGGLPGRKLRCGNFLVGSVVHCRAQTILIRSRRFVVPRQGCDKGDRATYLGGDASAGFEFSGRHRFLGNGAPVLMCALDLIRMIGAEWVGSRDIRL